MLVELIKNAVGRMVPTKINGEDVIPFMGVGKFIPQKQKYNFKISTNADYPADGNKKVKDLKEALVKSGLSNGMRISTHHHF